MRLAGRVDRLERPTHQAWRDAWEWYHRRTFDQLPHMGLAQGVRAVEADEEAARQAEHALLARHGLDRDLWAAWFNRTLEAIPDPDKDPDLTLWPHLLPPSPPIPEGVLDLAMQKANEDTLEGFLSTLLALMLLTATEVRTYRADTQGITPI